MSILVILWVSIIPNKRRINIPPTYTIICVIAMKSALNNKYNAAMLKRVTNSAIAEYIIFLVETKNTADVIVNKAKM